MFRSQLFDHLQVVVLRASAITTFSACLRRFIWYVAVCCLCVCVPDVLVCGMFDCEHSEDGQTIVTETCKVLIMCFTNIFNNIEF